MSKLLNLLIVLITIITLTGCVIPGKNNGNNNNTVEEPADYPYKEYFSNTVYAMKYFGKDGIDKGPTHGTFKDSWFAAVGQATIEDVMKDTPHSFNDKDYGGLCFTAKTGIELESVTFTVVAQKECYVKINLYGPKIDTEGKFELWNNSIVTSASSVSFKNGNYTTLDGSKLIKLTPNVPLTFTVDTLSEKLQKLVEMMKPQDAFYYL